jgi:uncharacterized protein
MKALDTNILVYAHREECPQYDKANALLIQLSEAQVPWALPWPCVYEFIRVVTHPRVMSPPTSLSLAWDNLCHLLDSPSLILLHETERHLKIATQLVKTYQVSGNLIFDAHIATLLIEHGIDELITGDSDFLRFKEFQVNNPFSG